MQTTAAPVHLADYSVRHFLLDAVLQDEKQVNEIVRALDYLDLKRRLTQFVRYELENRVVFSQANVTAVVEEGMAAWRGHPHVHARELLI